MVELTQEQNDCIAQSMNFIEQTMRFDDRSSQQYFTIHGLAGVGKTTVLAALAHKIPVATIVAPTGKAASVLRGKSGLEVITIHSAIYNYNGSYEDEDDPKRMVPHFTDKEDTGLERRIVLIDEASMVGTKIANDLLKTRAIVIACGDPGQLPPVKDKQFFSTADFTLKEIHRQALDSPIIRQAHRIRNGMDYEPDGDNFIVRTSSQGIDFSAYDVAICWKNATRKALNKRIRAEKGITGTTIQVGEPLMCLKNDYRYGIWNGEVYRAAKPRELGRPLTIEGGGVIGNPVIEGIDGNFEDHWKDEMLVPFALAYCGTCHKLQGSEVPNALIYDEMPKGQDRKSWLYTAITRASKSVTIVRPEGW